LPVTHSLLPTNNSNAFKFINSFILSYIMKALQGKYYSVYQATEVQLDLTPIKLCFISPLLNKDTAGEW
ncbi:MAG: hypothetical protein AAFY76_03540, partial [Cyanobacteria bacterium J06649_11]